MKYDAVLLDLDGVVYRGSTAIEGATVALHELAVSGIGYAFLTNNAARDVTEIARTIASFGIPAEAHQVRTSAQAAAEKLAHDIDTDSTVLVIGSPFLTACVEAHGFEVHTPEDTEWLKHNTPLAVVQGFYPHMSWWDISCAITALRAGALYRPTNPDISIPTARGILPGNGTFVDIVSRYTDAQPVFAGKPEPTMLHQAVNSLGASTPIMVGDQVSTDIEAAVAAGMDSALVLTGVTTLEQALRTPAKQRPTRIIATLPDLFEDLPPITVGTHTASCGSATVQINASSTITHTGDALLAANAALAYAHAHNTELNAGTLKGAL